jgi:hypothetical protein
VQQKFSIVLVLWLTLLYSISLAQAISLDFIPASLSVAQGQPLSVALAISGLGNQAPPSLAAFDVDVTFNPTLLSFMSATFGDPVLGDQLDLAGLGINAPLAMITSPGTLHLAEVSFDSQSDLDTIQAGDFTLATLTFDAIAQGAMTFGLTLNAFGNSSGDPLTDTNGNPPQVTPGTGAITVTPGQITSVPEPSTFTLFGAGMLALVGYTWRRQRF